MAPEKNKQHFHTIYPPKSSLKGGLECSQRRSHTYRKKSVHGETKVMNMTADMISLCIINH